DNPAADPGADKHANEIVASLARAIQPFAPGGNAYIVVDNHREPDGACELALKGLVGPLQVRSESDDARSRFDLPGNSDAHCGDRFGRIGAKIADSGHNRVANAD